MKLNLQIESNITGNKTIYNIIDCIGYWNVNGQRIYAANKANEIGSARSQDEARKTPFNEWLLLCMLYDCQTLVNEYESLKCGKGGNHVWVSNSDNVRVLFITVQ